VERLRSKGFPTGLSRQRSLIWRKGIEKGGINSPNVGKKVGGFCGPSTTGKNNTPLRKEILELVTGSKDRKGEGGSARCYPDEIRELSGIKIWTLSSQGPKCSCRFGLDLYAPCKGKKRGRSNINQGLNSTFRKAKKLFPAAAERLGTKSPAPAGGMPLVRRFLLREILA